MEWMEELEGENKNNVEVARSCRVICPANGLLIQQRIRYVWGSILNSAFHYHNSGSLIGMSRKFSRSRV